jgi:uncharacterized membrane protein YcaP (DUF421 family)
VRRVMKLPLWADLTIISFAIGSIAVAVIFNLEGGLGLFLVLFGVFTLLSCAFISKRIREFILSFFFNP